MRVNEDGGVFEVVTTGGSRLNLGPSGGKSEMLPN